MRNALKTPSVRMMTEMNYIRLEISYPSDAEMDLYKKELKRAAKLEKRNGLLYHWNKDKGVVCPRLK